jgi:hypothetical protein
MTWSPRHSVTVATSAYLVSVLYHHPHAYTRIHRRPPITPDSLIMMYTAKDEHISQSGKLLERNTLSSNLIPFTLFQTY